MTAKRFTMVCMDEDLVELNDNGIYKVFNDIGLEKLLNEQHETIQRLQQNIDELLTMDIEEELLEENEQLKQRINVLDDQITAQGIVIWGYQNRNQKLFDEKEHIKQTIRDMIEYERTELGRSVLKQLWEAIQ